ncbi:MAG TPA: hypothetical protein VGI45_28295 [Terracidiphilus sp.]|jgi:hypothetical protein
MTRSLSTMKNMILIATFALVSFTAVTASAQNKATVYVPFAFVANHQTLPAGHYEVLSSVTSLTLIDANTGKAQALFLVRHEAGDAIETRGRLRFQMSGSRHVLVEVQFAGSSTHSRLLGQPKQERQVARSGEPTIEVAMK